MSQANRPLPKIVSHAEWQSPHDALLAKESTHARTGRHGRRAAATVTRDDGEAHGLSVLLRDGDRIYRTYFTSRRGLELIGTIWSFLDRMPDGREEDWEDSPAGWLQSPP